MNVLIDMFYIVIRNLSSNFFHCQIYYSNMIPKEYSISIEKLQMLKEKSFMKYSLHMLVFIL